MHPPDRTLVFFRGAGLSPYIPVGVSSWHFPNLDAPQGPFAPHHHAQVGVLVGVVALGLCGAVGSAGPTCGEQPVNCDIKKRGSQLLTSSTGLPGLSPRCVIHGLRHEFREGPEIVGRKDQ